MIKKNIYIKLLKFKIFFNNNNIKITNIIFFHIIKILKILINIKNFGVFIPEKFYYKNNWIFNFWKKGLVTNFKIMKWYYVKYLFIKKFPSFLINLTSNNNISLEINKKKIPFINLFKTYKYKNIKNLGDFFLYTYNSLITIDIIYFFIKIFKYIKTYKNV